MLYILLANPSEVKKFKISVVNQSKAPAEGWTLGPEQRKRSRMLKDWEKIKKIKKFIVLYFLWNFMRAPLQKLWKWLN